jgi:hypothetical protein
LNLSIVKTATDVRAAATLAREAQWLRQLAEIPELDGQVPRLLEEGTDEAGHPFLVLGVVADGMRRSETRAFTPGHQRFLAHLGKARFRAADFEQSGCCEWLQQSLRALDGQVEPRALSVLGDAYRDCETALLYWTGPYVLSQGDFAPWNIRAFGSQLFVFDWGSARAEASPLDDVLHYLIVQRALSSQPLSIPMLKSAMAQAREFAVLAYPEWRWRAPVIGALTLVYLLGVILDRKADVEDPLVAGYWKLLENRPAWMPE